jgi:hypothetical protein
VNTTEPISSVRDVVVRPDRARSRRVKDPKTVAMEKRFASFLTRAMGPVVRDIGARLAEAEKKHLDLERRHRALAETIADEVFRFRGTWRQDKTYPKGAVVVHSGSLWFCIETNDVRPGTSGDWQLVVKQGSFHDTRRRSSAG